MVVSLLFVTFLAGAPQAAAELPTLSVGARVPGRLERETDSGTPQRVFTLSAAEAGPLVLHVESYDFDAQLALEGPEPDAVERADGGGIGTDARLVTETRAGATYRVVVSSRHGRDGDFVLSAEREPEPLPLGPALMEAEIEYWTVCAARARERGERPREITSLRLSGLVAYRIGRYDLALERFQEGLARTEDDPSLLGERRFVRTMVGMLLLERGNQVEAAEQIEEAGSEFGRVDDYGLWIHLQVRGDLEEARGSPDRAKDYYARAVEIAREAAFTTEVAVPLVRLAHVQARRGEHAEADALFKEALEIARPAGPQEELRIRSVYADALRLRGEPDRAREELETALASATDLSEQRALALLRLGELHRLAGRYESAHKRLEEALESSEALGSDMLATRVLLALATLARGVGDTAEARELLERAQEQARDLDLAGQLVDVLNELALLYGDLGSPERRRELHRNALELACKEDLNDQEIRTRINLGQLYEELGELDDARAMQTTALELAKETKAIPLAAVAEVNLGYLDLLEGDPEAALARSERVVARMQELGLTWETYAPLETIARAAVKLGDTDRASTTLARLEQMLELRGAGLNLERSAGFRSRHAWWAETLPQDLALLQVASSEPGSAERQAAVDAGFRAAGAWKGRALQAGILSRRPPLADTGLRLPPDALLVEYAAGSERLVAYSLQAGSLRIHDLGAREDLYARAERFTRHVSVPSELGGPEEIRGLGSALFDDLLRPVLAARSRARCLTIVPTGALAALPFEALVVGLADGVQSAGSFDDLVFVLDRHVVSYAPSTGVLAELANAEARPRSEHVLVMADPVYPEELLTDGGTPGLARDPRSLGRLRGTRDEAVALARLILGDEFDRYAPSLQSLLEERSGVLATPGMTLCLGAEASPARLRADLTDFDVIHFATHGYVDPDDPQNTGLELSYSSLGSGFLSLFEVHELQLDARLAVLSACDTARGRILRGEGVQSLAHAFLRAGARSVVASLYEVLDLETAELMQRFYELHLLDGLTAAEALHEAKLGTRRAGRPSAERVRRGHPVRRDTTAPALWPGHPFHWSAPIFVGPPPR